LGGVIAQRATFDPAGLTEFIGQLHS
jgi:hypothetical protein